MSGLLDFSPAGNIGIAQAEPGRLGHVPLVSALGIYPWYFGTASREQALLVKGKPSSQEEKIQMFKVGSCQFQLETAVSGEVGGAEKK